MTAAPRTCTRCGTPGVTGPCPFCTAAFRHRPDVARMSVEERAQEFAGWIGVLEIDFALLHQRLEELAGRPIWTHELAQPERIVAEIRRQRPATVADVLAKIPPEKLIVVFEEDDPR